MILQSEVRNRLLSFLSQDDFNQIAPHLQLVELPRLFKLSEANKVDRYSYFLESGLGSIVAISPEGQQAEVGIFGRDGMTPTALVLDAGSAPFDVFMQGTGTGYRVESSVLKVALDASPPFRNLLARYAQTLAVQTAFTGLSNAVHNIDERLARWILMCHDRTEGNEIFLTHDFLAIMLAVRRPSVTTALHVLEANKFITAERGLITVRNRRAMEAFALDAYGPSEQEYVRLIGPMH